jgi:hypothetical protein
VAGNLRNRQSSQDRQSQSVNPVPRQRSERQSVTATPRPRNYTERNRDDSGRFIASQAASTPVANRFIASQAASTPVATPSGSDNVGAVNRLTGNGDSTRDNTRDSVTTATARNHAQNSASAINGNQLVVTPNRTARDSSGRFVAANNSSQNQETNQDNTGDTTSNNEGKRQNNNTILNRVADRIVSAVTETREGAEEIDPAIKALGEVATPLARTYQVLTGGNSGDSRWLKKIFSILKFTRQDSTLFQRTTARTLRNIEGNTEDNGSGSNSGIMSYLAGLFTLGGKALIKKIPLLGALLSAIGAFGDVSENEGSNLTRQQKDEQNGKAIGGAAGSFAGLLGGAKWGAMAGSLAGPVGTVIGSVIGGAAGMFFGDKAGQVIGEVTGFWVNELRESDIPGMISNAWAATTDYIKSAWGDAVSLFSEKWTDIKNMFAPIVDQIC